METPTMTLQEVRRALEAQDRQLQAACDERVLEDGHRPILVAPAALERLREACADRQRPTSHTKPTAGTRC
jgi:hypothetical protein